ncbi:barstar family protein [Streptomyces hydrogenans]|uniref:barstar family protein n=1 Tax=Streptomyces hydrogenans TaxID=1873719 RepID=UPI00331C7E78
MVTIDEASVASEGELHRLLQREFDFPDFYGQNWAAFWMPSAALFSSPSMCVSWVGSRWRNTFRMGR